MSGDAPLSADLARATQFDASLVPGRGHVRLTPDGATGDPVRIDALDWQPGLASFRVPAAALGAVDPTCRPIDIPAALLPDHGMAAGRARATWTGAALAVTPVRPVHPPAPRRPPPLWAVERIGSGLRVPVLAGVCLIATGFLSAMVAHAVTDDGSRSLWAGIAPSLSVFDMDRPAR